MVTLTQSGKAALDDLVANMTVENTLPGFVLGATNAEGDIYFNTGGYKILNDPASGKIDHDAVLWICSMAKLVTHIAALQLVEQGRLSVETPVSQYFPQFANPVVLDNITSPNPTFKPAKNVVRVQHLINFTSGLFYQFTMDFGINMVPPYARDHDMNEPHSQFFSILKGDLPGIPLQFEPGTNFAYGYSSDVLGFIVEKISGKTLDEYMKENIFKPLDIKASFFLTPELKEKNFPLYFREKDGKLYLWDNQPGTNILEHDPMKVSRLMGGVGLYMSLHGYLKLLRHILQIYDGKAANPILNQDAVKAMFVGALDEVASNSLCTLLGAPPKSHSWSNALGTCEVDYPGGRKKGSAFWSGWAGTHFFIDPTTGIATVYGSQITSLQGGPFDTAILKGRDAFEQILYANLTS